MKKKHDIDESDKDLFRTAMRGVKPISHSKITTEAPKPQRKRQSYDQNLNKNPLNLFESEYFDDVDGEDKLEFYRPGLQHKVLRKFRRGQYNVEAILDMHGMRALEAKEALNEFILHCLDNNIRHVIIIHGKGRGDTKPVLKNKLNQWLRQIEYVLAFVSATQQDGYTGAVYVLLKGRS